MFANVWQEAVFFLPEKYFDVAATWKNNTRVIFFSVIIVTFIYREMSQ